MKIHRFAAVVATLSTLGCGSEDAVELSPDGKRLAVTSIATVVRPEDGDVVTFYDTETLAELGSVTVGLGPQGHSLGCGREPRVRRVQPHR